MADFIRKSTNGRDTEAASQPREGDLPAILPGHWTTPAGRDMALATLDDPHMARSRERISDFALANEVFLSPGIANLTYAKERIRWLSAMLAALTQRPPEQAGAASQAREDRMQQEDKATEADMAAPFTNHRIAASKQAGAVPADESWRQYAADFDAMSDEEIERESNDCRDQVNELESWLESVAAWEAAGKPRGGQP